MSETEQSICPICTEVFEAVDILVAYRNWPSSQLWGHMDCIASISADEGDDDDE
jgi:hypothetical protein